MNTQYFRIDCIPVVWRNTAKEKTNKTVFGDTILTLKRCNTCGVLQPTVNFYLVSKSDTILRNQCCSCWDKHNGRTKPLYKGESFSIDGFIFE
jgi:hypothetical protein